MQIESFKSDFLHASPEPMPPNTKSFNYFTKSSIQSFNNTNIQSIIQNKKKQNKDQDYIGEFLNYFSKNYLKIGNQFVKKFIGHTQTVKDVVFWPQNNGIISTSNDKTTKVWDIDSGQCIHTFSQHSSKVLCLSLNHPFLVTGSKDQTIQLYDLSNFKHLFEFIGHTHKVNSVKISNNGLYIASGSEDYTVKIWDIHQRSLSFNLTKHKDGVLDVDWNQDDTIIISSSHDKYIRLWSFETGDQIYCIKGGQDGIYEVKFSPCGKYFAFTNIKQIHLWGVRTRKCLGTFNGHENIVRGICFSPDGLSLSSAGEDHQIRIWNISTFQCEAILDDEQIKSDGITSLSYSPDGQYLVSGDFLSQVIIWKTSQYVQTLKVHEDEINDVAYSKTGKWFATAGSDCLIKIWDIRNNDLVDTLIGHEHSVTKITFLEQDKYLLSSSDDKNILLWDLQNFKIIHTFQGHRHNVTCISISPSEEYFASASIDKSIRIWSLFTMSQVSILIGHREGISSICWLLNDQIISGSYDNSLIIWQKIDNQFCIKKQLFGHTGAINDICVGLAESFLFSASIDNTIRVWELKTEQQMIVLKCHSDSVYKVHYSKELNIICSISDDKTVCIWNCSTMTLQAILPLQCRSMIFSPESQFFLLGDSSGCIQTLPSTSLNNYIHLQRLLNTQPLNSAQPKLLKTYLPLNLTPLHYALYTQNMPLFQEIIIFCKENSIFIDPQEDYERNSVFDLASKNRTALQMLLEYYAVEGVQEDGGAGGLAGYVFSKYLHVLIKERIPGLSDFLDARSFKPTGDRPKVCEYFSSIKTLSIPSAIPSESNYQLVAPSNREIKNKSAITFRLYDLPNILQVPSQFMQELSQLPPNSLIFQTQFIDDLLSYKWTTYAKKFYIKDLIIYLNFSLLYTINILWIKEPTISLLVIGIIIFFLMTQKVLALMDITTYMIAGLSLVLDIETGGVVDMGIKSGSLFLVWLKALIYMQGSKKMGFILRLLIQVIVDIWPSILLLLLFVIMFSMSSFVVQDPLIEEKQDLFSVIIMAFSCLFLTFNDYFIKDNENGGQFFIFMFFTVLLNVTYMSYVVAILNETKDRVLGQEKIAINYQRLLFINNLEQQLSSQQLATLSNQKYLLVAECLQEESIKSQQLRNNIQDLYEKMISQKTTLHENAYLEIQDHHITNPNANEFGTLQGKPLSLRKRLQNLWNHQEQLEHQIWEVENYLENRV